MKLVKDIIAWIIKRFFRKSKVIVSTEIKTIERTINNKLYIRGLKNGRKQWATTKGFSNLLN